MLINFSAFVHTITKTFFIYIFFLTKKFYNTVYYYINQAESKQRKNHLPS